MNRTRTIDQSFSTKTKAPPSAPIGLWRNIGLIFFIVSGGAYGLESLVGAVGAEWSLLFVIFMPVFWVIPISLMVMELTAMLPEPGGYYAWVKIALGKNWGFQEGWWTLCYSVADLAIYPVLFVTYLSFFIPSLQDPTLKWAFAAAFILASLTLNFAGVVWLGRSVIFSLVFVSVPFLVMSFAGVYLGKTPEFFKHPTLPHLEPGAIAGGLAIILWNYCGWDNISTYVSEVEQPSRTYVKSIFWAIGLIMLSYLIPLVGGFHTSTAEKFWNEPAGWPSIAEKIAGPFVGMTIGVVALFSTSSQFSSQLLYLSRLIEPMAKDGWLPQFLVKKKNENNEPVWALVALGLVAALACALSFTKLVVVDILFYSLGIILEFAALIALRRQGRSSSFRIPLNSVGLIVMALFPVGLALTVAITSLQAEGGKVQLCVVGFGIALGLIIQKWKSR